MCVCGYGAGEIQCDYILFLRFYAYISVDLVKCSMLNLVREIWYYRNDHFHYYYCLEADEENLILTQVFDAVVVDPKGMKPWHVWQFHMGRDLVVVQHQGHQGREL